MSKLQKCIFITQLLNHHRKMTRQEITSRIAQRWPGEPEISRSSFVRYLDYISENLPYTVTYSQVTRNYSIHAKATSRSDMELFRHLYSMYSMEAATPLMLKHRDRIHRIETMTGTDKLETVLQAIDEHRGIECDYQSFTQSTIKHRTFIPVFLTSWDGRWYCVAEVTTHPDSHPYTYALERMSNISLTNEKYIPRFNGSYEDYFRDSFGIQAASPDDHPIDIMIRARDAQVGYLRAKPLHPSQREDDCIESDGRIIEATFCYHLSPCYNFYQKLLSYREGIEVLSPQSVREELQRILTQMMDKY